MPDQLGARLCLEMTEMLEWGTLTFAMGVFLSQILWGDREQINLSVLLIFISIMHMNAPME